MGPPCSPPAPRLTVSPFLPSPPSSDSFPGPFSSAGVHGERRHGRLHPRLQRRRRGRCQGAPGGPGSGPAAPPELGPARPGVLRPADRPSLGLGLVRQPQLQPRRRQQRQQQGLGLHHREPPGPLTAARPPPQPREDASETQPLPSAHVALVQPLKPAERSRGPVEHAGRPSPKCRRLFPVAHPAPPVRSPASHSLSKKTKAQLESLALPSPPQRRRSGHSIRCV